MNVARVTFYCEIHPCARVCSAGVLRSCPVCRTVCWPGERDGGGGGGDANCRAPIGRLRQRRRRLRPRRRATIVIFVAVVAVRSRRDADAAAGARRCCLCTACTTRRVRVHAAASPVLDGQPPPSLPSRPSTTCPREPGGGADPPYLPPPDTRGLPDLSGASSRCNRVIIVADNFPYNVRIARRLAPETLDASTSAPHPPPAPWVTTVAFAVRHPSPGAAFIASCARAPRVLTPSPVGLQ